MENPHEQVQNALLSRIINNMVRSGSTHLNHPLSSISFSPTNKNQENLNESIVTMNKSLQELNRENMNSELLSQMWENYSKNSQFNLETTGHKQEPM